MLRRWRSVLESICIPVGAIAIALLLFGLFCAVQGYNPLAIYASIYKAAFASWFSWQNTLIRSAPLMLSALCTVLPARLGLIVIGNEGALVLGGLMAAVTGLGMANVSPVIALLAMAIAGITVGGLWIMLIGALRHYRGVNETISSLLLNYVAIAFLNHMVEGPWRDPSSLNQPSTYPLAEALKLGDFPGSRIHYGLLYGLVVCAIAYVLIQRTTFGFAIRTIGGNIRAARIAGLAVGKLTLAICFLAGSCAGLAGMVEVAAVHGRANGALHSNYGYTGILVAFVAKQNPLAVVLVSTLLGGILTSGSILQRAHGMPDATVLVFQGLIFLVILYSESLYGQFPWFQEPAIPDDDAIAPVPSLDPLSSTVQGVHQ
ncbi:MAG: ABC transporter permease [Oculatellaceae cyanobacterium bins.114]|nr:ABC transporter permease [Oculatellaceae cyanobacterium bins.114]